MGIGEGHTWWDVVTVFPGMYHLGPECPLLVSRPLLLDGSLFGREGSAVTVGVFFVVRVGGCRLLWRLCASVAAARCPCPPSWCVWCVVLLEAGGDVCESGVVGLWLLEGPSRGRRCLLSSPAKRSRAAVYSLVPRSGSGTSCCVCLGGGGGGCGL